MSALLPFFAGHAPTVQLAATSGVSSPQRNKPPRAVLTAMKWLPRPSLRTLAVVGALAALCWVRHHPHTGGHRLAG